LTPYLFEVMSWDSWQDWLDQHFWSLLVIVGLMVATEVLFRRVVRGALHGALARASKLGKDDPAAMKQRADTLFSTVAWVITSVVFFVGITLVLDEVGISVTALVAGLGIVGVALGFGAQTLVRDLINGVFILVEDQFRVGDFVDIGGVSGEVTEITPRRTVLRDLDGHVHSVPNGAIGVATNRTRGLSRVKFEIAIPAGRNLDAATAMINQVCAELAAERPQEILTVPRVQGITGLDTEGATLQVLGDVRPGRQWDLASELRLRIRRRLEAEEP
jgi:small conductance mechanosensitive channel